MLLDLELETEVQIQNPSLNQKYKHLTEGKDYFITKPENIRHAEWQEILVIEKNSEGKINVKQPIPGKEIFIFNNDVYERYITSEYSDIEVLVWFKKNNCIFVKQIGAVA